MQLTLETGIIGSIVILRCTGRITSGDETKTLDEAIHRHLLESACFVLDLAGISYVDSSGLGTLVRLVTAARTRGGDIKLANVTEFVQNTLRITNLSRLFEHYPSVPDAASAFTRHEQPRKRQDVTRADAVRTVGRILCVDSSVDVLAFLRTLLRGHCYEVTTCAQFPDAKIMLKSSRWDIVVIGPNLECSGTIPAIEQLRALARGASLLYLPDDFSLTHAGDAASAILSQVSQLFRNDRQSEAS